MEGVEAILANLPELIRGLGFHSVLLYGQYIYYQLGCTIYIMIIITTNKPSMSNIRQLYLEFWHYCAIIIVTGLAKHSGHNLASMDLMTYSLRKASLSPCLRS